ncbi:polysaccharide biosynthesis protein [Euhalothece natronophila Z-M001]|uniref:Polysaccharide biosynthesis protein n=2 Tax=Euhalothece TaxID=65097 RepID=A0A5B8NKC4_9CHRO|nr:polysaccharide biosynthesis protein [Euhalothece natronophila Z-M001]
MVKLFAHLCRKIHASLSRSQKQWILVSTDLILLIVSMAFAFVARFETLAVGSLFLDYQPIIIITLLVKLLVFLALGMYRPILRYLGLDLLYKGVRAIALSYAIIIVIGFFAQLEQLPRTVFIIDALLSLVLMVGVRLTIRWCLYNANSPLFVGEVPPKAIIYGAGNAGTELAQALCNQKTYSIVAFVDDNPELQKQQINGLTVYPSTRLPKLVRNHKVKTILLAMPSVEGEVKQTILNNLKQIPVTVKTVPGLGELINGNVPLSQLRQIDVTDLLGRQEVPPILELLSTNITGKAVLVTGAGGSIGSELCRQIIQQNPRVLVLYERNEDALYNIDQELEEIISHLRCVPCLGSVTDENHFRNIIQDYAIETIYHAAAYKHVPLVQYNPTQGIINNVYGTLVTARTAKECGVKNYVLISTDKAVRPTNIMGATKRIGELIVQAFAQNNPEETTFVMVRFGNVLDSNGSVVPRFRKQIAERKPITVTHRDITRYFMSIPEAARLVIQAGALGKGGEVFLLDMGKPIKIYDLALQMIKLSGLEVGKDIELRITGLRPGEKLYEELLIDTNTSIPTSHPKIYAAKEQMISWSHLEIPLFSLLDAARKGDQEKMMNLLSVLVPEFQGQTEKAKVKS